MFNTHDYNDNAIIVCNGNSSGSYPVENADQSYIKMVLCWIRQQVMKQEEHRRTWKANAFAGLL